MMDDQDRCPEKIVVAQPLESGPYDPRAGRVYRCVLRRGREGEHRPGELLEER